MNVSDPGRSFVEIFNIGESIAAHRFSSGMATRRHRGNSVVLVLKSFTYKDIDPVSVARCQSVASPTVEYSTVGRYTRRRAFDGHPAGVSRIHRQPVRHATGSLAGARQSQKLARIVCRSISPT